MTLQTFVRQGCLIVQMPPEVDIGNAELLRQEMGDIRRTLLDPGSRNGVTAVVVDWAAAPFLTMAGVAMLNNFRQHVDELGLPVRVVTFRRAARAVLQAVGLDAVIPVHDSVEQALAEGDTAGEEQERPELGANP